MSATDTKLVLDVVDLSVGFGDAQPVKGISFSLRPGEKIGLVGESGSGKSLTALSIMRLTDRARLGGQVLLDGENLLELSQRQMEKVRGGRVAMVYQDPMSSLNPVRTIAHQLIEAIRLHTSASKRDAFERAVELLTEVGVPLPRQRMAQYPHEFSGGMRQRVMIAMAMSAKPQVLIADEPTTALDVTTQARIIDLLDKLAEDHGTAVVLITHDLGVAAGFCETIHVMRHGEIVESAPAQKLYRHPQHAYSKALLAAVVDLTIDVDRPIPSGADAVEAAAVADAPAVAFPRTEPIATREHGEILLTVDSVTKSFRIGSGETVRAVDNVSFQIRKGETFGLVGESGAGKSTVSRAVLALTSVDSGQVLFEGRDLNSMGRERLRALRRRMQVVFQDPFSALNRRQTVAQIITAPLAAHGIGTKQTRTERVAEMMDLVGLSAGLADRLPRTMSGGECQRVSIARSLVLDPDFLVLDESVSSMDVSTQAQILNLLRELQQRLGLTYLFISHDLAVVRYMAQHVAVMKDGVIVEQGSRDELFANPTHDYTKALMAAIPVADPQVERTRRKEAARLVARVDETSRAGIAS